MSLKGKAPTAEDVAPSLPSSRTRTALESSHCGRVDIPKGICIRPLDPRPRPLTRSQHGRDPGPLQTKNKRRNRRLHRIEMLSFLWRMSSQFVYCAFDFRDQRFPTRVYPLAYKHTAPQCNRSRHSFSVLRRKLLVEMQPADPNRWKVQPWETIARCFNCDRLSLLVPPPLENAPLQTNGMLAELDHDVLPINSLTIG